MTLSQAMRSNPGHSPECVEAQEGNEAGRDKLKECKGSEKPHERKADTIATMISGEPASAYSGHASLSKRRQEHFVEGTAPEDRSEGIDLCGENHQFAESGKAGSNKMNGGHSEARLLADTMKGRTKNSPKLGLTFKIDWRNSSHPNGRPVPCPDCFRMMCHVQDNCNADIFVCNDEGEKVPLTKDDCQNEKNGEGGYNDFTDRIEGVGL
ncbi:MAG: hypothetical protein FWD67_10770 [Betaproteobacteria bacterium]|nr:hypothetical protein [Betaproteobacteria bacterium]